MGLFNRQVWLNFLALLPATGLTVLTIAVAFLRFYDAQDFGFLQYIGQPQRWSNRLTVAALLVALVNFGIEWNRRNCLKTRFANEKQTALLKQSNAELQKSNAELRSKNEQLAELESKIDGLFSKYDINSPLATNPDQP